MLTQKPFYFIAVSSSISASEFASEGIVKYSFDRHGFSIIALSGEQLRLNCPEKNRRMNIVRVALMYSVEYCSPKAMLAYCNIFEGAKSYCTK